MIRNIIVNPSNWMLFSMTWTLIKIFCYMATGNKKYISTKEVRFLIWSIPAKITCPFRTKHCEKLCYAVKAEKAYKDALPSRMRNLAFSRLPMFVPFMVAALHYICNLPMYRKAKQIVFRIHESGDFYNQVYTDKWMDIVKACSDIPNLVFMAYTKSAVYFEKYDLKEYSNLALRGSIWDDTTPEQEQLLRKHPIYTACEQAEWDALPEENKCHCEDCAACGKCWNSKKDIWCVIH